MTWLSGWKTYLAAAGAFGMAVYQVSQGNYEQAISFFTAGLAAAGLRHAISTSAPAK